MSREISGRELFEFQAQLARSIDGTPVSSFYHVPGSYDYDSNIGTDLVGETAYGFEEISGTTLYWLAVLKRNVGYFGEFEWVGEPDTGEKQIFVRNVASYKPPVGDELDRRVHPPGWAHAHGHRLQPPPHIQTSRPDWATLLRENLVGKNVLPDDFHEIVEAENECALLPGMLVEATATDRINALRPARVEGHIGRRVKLRYVDDLGGAQVCWAHEFDRDMLVPCGWARLHGQQLISTRQYWESSKKIMISFAEEDEAATIFDFKPLLVPEFVLTALANHRFEIGAKLELIDPLARDFISVGTIAEVLENQLLVIRVDGATTEQGEDHHVVLHATSPLLLPAGFATENDLVAYFRPPTANFSFEDHRIVPRELFQRTIHQRKLKSGDLLEVIGVAGSNLLYLGRIARVVAHLVLVHFEGYPPSEDQFFPSCSENLYAFGWADLVGHPLQLPPLNDNAVVRANRGRKGNAMRTTPGV